jgi:hypothetical protein
MKLDHIPQVHTDGGASLSRRDWPGLILSYTPCTIDRARRLLGVLEQFEPDWDGALKHLTDLGVVEVKGNTIRRKRL